MCALFASCLRARVCVHVFAGRACVIFACTTVRVIVRSGLDVIQEAIRLNVPTTPESGRQRGKMLNWQGSVRARLAVLERPQIRSSSAPIQRYSLNILNILPKYAQIRFNSPQIHPNAAPLVTRYTSAQIRFNSAQIRTVSLQLGSPYGSPHLKWLSLWLPLSKIAQIPMSPSWRARKFTPNRLLLFKGINTADHPRDQNAWKRQFYYFISKVCFGSVLANPKPENPKRSIKDHL
jgi:hypothetical protein